MKTTKSSKSNTRSFLVDYNVQNRIFNITQYHDIYLYIRNKILYMEMYKKSLLNCSTKVFYFQTPINCTDLKMKTTHEHSAATLLLIRPRFVLGGFP